LGDCNTHTNHYSESYSDLDSLPGPKPSKEKGSVNEDVNISILSLINHYTAFGDAIKGNSATMGSHSHPRAIPTENILEDITPPLFSSYPKTKPESKKQDLIVAIVPAYNEEIAIGSMVVHIRQYVDIVIVVDDGSTDNTAFIARAAGAEVITLGKNQGKAAAMMKGFQRARELNPMVTVMLDGDGQHNPPEIPALIKPILEGKADLVIGSRFLINGNNIPRYRQLGQKTLNLATQAGAGFASTDSQSGFRAISRKGLRQLTFNSEGYNLESDMITHFVEKELAITEVPITVKYDVPNKHKKNPVEHGVDIFSHLVGIIGYKRPLLSFGIPGLVLVTFGIIIGSWAFATYYASHMLPFGPSLISGIAIMAGLLLITCAFILNSLVQIVKKEKGAD